MTRGREGKVGGYIIKTVSLPLSYYEVMDKLLTLLGREDKALSTWFREQAEEYVERHWPGNPQRPITVYIKDHKDWLEADQQNQLEILKKVAEDNFGIIDYNYIVENLKHITDVEQRLAKADSLAKLLHKQGTKVIQ